MRCFEFEGPFAHIVLETEDFGTILVLSVGEFVSFYSCLNERTNLKAVLW